MLNKINEKTEIKKGFEVGPTIKSCTKGIWIWNRLIDCWDLGIDRDVKALIMDCEGLSGVDSDTNHNSYVYLIALVLSSFFIFNSTGKIEETQLTQLALILNLAK